MTKHKELRKRVSKPDAVHVYEGRGHKKPDHSTRGNNMRALSGSNFNPDLDTGWSRGITNRKLGATGTRTGELHPLIANLYDQTDDEYSSDENDGEVPFDGGKSLFSVRGLLEYILKYEGIATPTFTPDRTLDQGDFEDMYEQLARILNRNEVSDGEQRAAIWSFVQKSLPIQYAILASINPEDPTQERNLLDLMGALPRDNQFADEIAAALGTGKRGAHTLEIDPSEDDIPRYLSGFHITTPRVNKDEK